MSQLHRLKIDITTLNECIILHGVNTLGKMGAGIAKALAKEYPKMYREYVETCNIYGDEILGKISVYYDQDRDVRIINCYTQNRIGSSFGNPAANLDAVKSSLMLVFDYLSNKEETNSIFMPEIGCH